MSPDSLPSLRFDFAKAVADARRDFPEKTQKVAFFNLDDPDVGSQMEKFYDGLSPENKRNIDAIRQEDPDFLTPKDWPHAWRSPVDGVGLMTAYGSREHRTDMETLAYKGLDVQKQLHYTFAHELGHLVVKDADRAGNSAEHAADAFAVLRGFQSSFLKKDDVRVIAEGRDMLGWLNCDISHITSMTMDALVINPKSVEFTALTPGEIAKIAVQHAQAFSQSAEPGATRALRSAIPTWGFGRENRLQSGLEGLAELVARNEKSSLTFYVAARILLTAKARKEAGDPDLAAMDMSGANWDKTFKRIEKAGRHKKVAEDKPKTQLQKLASRLKPLSI